MGSRRISQEAFDEMVKENIDELGMEPTEALQDAIHTLSLQGVSLSGIVTSENNPVVDTLDLLKRGMEGGKYELLDALNHLLIDEASANVAIATRNGALELLIRISSDLQQGAHPYLLSALNALASLLHDLESTEVFRKNDGPNIIVSILNDGSTNPSILNSAFSVVAAAATGNEVLKELFMDLKVDHLIVRTLRENTKEGIPCIYDALCILLTSDDNRVVASQVSTPNKS
ncbi:hypothetical protein LIER_09189 [Lithospermum erythrorhizon]|uniref:Uncharacterized protein n=1 Tax=Lithospermum erythrorhizon TaxID=34254 RepID=A0AAV3PFZ7_LITER